MPNQVLWAPDESYINTRWWNRTRVWNNTPNYGALAKDEKPVNGYSDVRKIWTTIPLRLFCKDVYGNVIYDIPGWTGNLSDSIYQFKMNEPSATFGPIWADKIAGLENAVIVKALGKIADAKVNIPVALAEAKKTSDLIYDTARRIDRAYRAFRKGRVGDMARELNITPKRVHKTWLEYKYGWMPLLMDVKGSAEFFAQQNVVRPLRFVVTAKEKVAMTISDNITYVPWGGLPTDVAYEQFDALIEMKAKIWCELSSPHLTELQQLGLTNPALVAWELVPFSFVFDWFVSVGDWLTGLTALQGVTVRRSMISYVEERDTMRASHQTFRFDGARHYEYGPELATIRQRSYQRTVPSLNTLETHPPVKNGFDFKKLVTSLALLRSGYRGNARL